jgi:two-component system cell cycle sensor histidine kinase/response regulator CckA
VPESPPDPLTLLVVDDEEVLRHFLQRVLHRAGYEVFLAASGYEALALLAAAEGTIDLVITDILMPGMRGDELASKIAQLPSAPPVLLVSASDVPPPSASTAKFLQKPFTGDDLLRAVQEVLEAGGRRRRSLDT